MHFFFLVNVSCFGNGPLRDPWGFPVGSYYIGLILYGLNLSVLPLESLSGYHSDHHLSEYNSPSHAILSQGLLIQHVEEEMETGEWEGVETALQRPFQSWWLWFTHII